MEAVESRTAVDEDRSRPPRRAGAEVATEHHPEASSRLRRWVDRVDRRRRWKVPWGNGDVIRRIEILWAFQAHGVCAGLSDVQDLEEGNVEYQAWQPASSTVQGVACMIVYVTYSGISGRSLLAIFCFRGFRGCVISLEDSKVAGR